MLSTGITKGTPPLLQAEGAQTDFALSAKPQGSLCVCVCVRESARARQSEPCKILCKDEMLLREEGARE